MTFELVIARYGLIAIFLGAGIEGETAVIAGGVLAQRHMLPLWAAVVAGASGSFAADQLFFLAGRHFREHRRIRKVIAKPAFARALASLEKHPVGFILAFRFFYGLRTVSPVAVGTSHIPAARFAGLNAVAASLWAVLFAGIGYVFGHQILRIVGKLFSGGHPLLVAGAAAAALVAVLLAIRWFHGRST